MTQNNSPPPPTLFLFPSFSLSLTPSGLDLSALLTDAKQLNPGAEIRKKMGQDHLLGEALDNFLIEQSKPALEQGK